jgi:hypothetical protein
MTICIIPKSCIYFTLTYTIESTTLKTDVTASTRFTSSSSHQTVGELVLCYYLLVAKQLSLARFASKRIIRTATNIKNKSEIKIDTKRKTNNTIVY